MKSFTDKISNQITGTLSCFDRVIFKGHLQSISYPEGLDKFISGHGLKIKDFAKFVQTQSDRLILHAKTIAAHHKRLYQYLPRHIRKDDEARHIAAKLNISRGLVCIFSELETCPSFKIAYAIGRPRIIAAYRKCLCLYYYFLHPDLGLIHVRIQSWFPFVVQFAVNGHEWLAIQMRRRNMSFAQIDNAFIKIAHPEKAQHLANQFSRLNWPALLQRLAAFVNPLLPNLLAAQSYYWTTDQAEFATDIMFKNRAALAPLFRELIKHAFLCFGASSILGFLGKKLTANFTSDVITNFKTSPAKAGLGSRVSSSASMSAASSPKSLIPAAGASPPTDMLS